MRNQRIALVLLGLGLLAGRTYGQGGSTAGTPAVEISGGYSYIHTNLISPGGCCFGVNGGNAGALIVQMPADGQPFRFFPPADCANVPLHVGGDFLPRIEAVLVRWTRRLGG